MSVPTLLALETATRRASAALVRGGVCLSERVAAEEGAHSESLLESIDGVLRDTGTSLPQVDAVAVAIGPGSFTSLRIGVATAKGLCFGTSRPVVPVSTLTAMAEGFSTGADGLCLSLLDARKGELYAAAFEAGGEGELVLRVREGIYTPAELAAALAPHAGALSVVGEDAARLEPLLAPLLPDHALLSAPEEAGRAGAVGRLAARAFGRGEAIPARDLVPRYLRRAQAEVERTGLRTESDPL